ncbi:MAG: hypothetical protein ACYS22_16340, partial [Planctomycetota bacterium]
MTTRQDQSAQTARRGGAPQLGSALISVMLFALALAALSSVLIRSIPITIQDSGVRSSIVQARYWAGEAASRAELDLRNGGTGNLTGNAKDGKTRSARPANKQDVHDALPYT